MSQLYPSGVGVTISIPTFRCYRCQVAKAGVPYKPRTQTGEVSGAMLLGDNLGMSSSAVYGDVDVCEACAGIIDEQAEEYQRELVRRNIAAIIVFVAVFGAAGLLMLLAMKMP